MFSSSEGFRKNCGEDVGVSTVSSSCSEDVVMSLAESVGIFDGGVGVSANSNNADVGVEGGDFGVSMGSAIIGMGVVGAFVGDGVTKSPSISNAKVSVSSKSPPVVSMS